MITQPQIMSTMRFLGLSRNPLRRFSDRVQSALLLFVLVGCIAALPVAVQTAQAAERGAIHKAQTQLSGLHPVPATTLQAGNGIGPGQSSTVIVKATWKAPDGTQRVGGTRVAKGTPEGATVTIWSDNAGNGHKAPMTRTAVQLLAILVGVGSYLGLVLALFLAYRAVCRVLNRARMASWAAEWEKLSQQ